MLAIHHPIRDIATRANGFSFKVKIQSLSMGAHPADLAARVSHYKGIRWHILRYHGACTDKSVFPNLIATNDGGIGTNGRTFSDPGFKVLTFTVHRASWVVHIGEYHAGAEEHIIITNDPGINGDVVLHFDIVTQNNPIGHKYVLTQVAILPYHNTRHDMAKMPNRCAFTNFGAFVDDGRWMCEEGGCWLLAVGHWIRKELIVLLTKKGIKVKFGRNL